MDLEIFAADPSRTNASCAPPLSAASAPAPQYRAPPWRWCRAAPSPSQRPHGLPRHHPSPSLPPLPASSRPLAPPLTSFPLLSFLRAPPSRTSGFPPPQQPRLSVCPSPRTRLSLKCRCVASAHLHPKLTSAGRSGEQHLARSAQHQTAQSQEDGQASVPQALEGNAPGDAALGPKVNMLYARTFQYRCRCIATLTLSNSYIDAVKMAGNQRGAHAPCPSFGISDCALAMALDVHRLLAGLDDGEGRYVHLRSETLLVPITAIEAYATRREAGIESAPVSYPCASSPSWSASSPSSCPSSSYRVCVCDHHSKMS